MADLSNIIHQVNGHGKEELTYYPILVVGAGESGLAVGARLKEKLGFDQFRIFERQAGIGGTWWINRYPGVACDVPAVFYSFSFASNPEWSTLFPEGAEIMEYLQGVCNKYQLNDKIQLNTDVTEMRWLEDEELWEVQLAHLVTGAGDLSSKDRQQRVRDQGQASVYLRQETVKAKIVISAAGALVEPNAFPDSVPGRQNFEGKVFHSARWDYEVDLRDKDVIVLGTGCSAIQFVPQLAKAPFNAKSVTQVMRSPPWIMAQPPPPFGKEKWEKWSPILLSRIPGFRRLVRILFFLKFEVDFYSVFPNTPRNLKKRKETEKALIRWMQTEVPEKYHEILTPNYSFGCKRRVFDSGWFSSLRDPKVELTTQPLTSLQPRGATLGPGRTYPEPQDTSGKVPTDSVQIPADVVILANGFELTTWLHPLKIRGKGGALMQDVWDERGGAQAYMGATMDGFPNFFMVFGPNTATGHTSVVLASENMVEYSLKFIKQILSGDVKTVEVKKEAEIAWTKELQKNLNKTVFNTGGCYNWYKTANGWNSTVYPYSQIDFYLRCMFPRWSHYDIQYTSKGQVKKWAWRFLRVNIFILLLLGGVQMRREGGSFAAVPGILMLKCRQVLTQGLDFFTRVVSRWT